MPGALTTVTICWTPVEAGLLRDALGAEGIRSFVRETNLGTIDPFVTPALGGIRLDVDSVHLERARAIVAAVRASLPARTGDGDLCPACRVPLEEGSDDCSSCGWTLADAGVAVDGEGPAPPSPALPPQVSLPPPPVGSHPRLVDRYWFLAAWLALAITGIFSFPSGSSFLPASWAAGTYPSSLRLTLGVIGGLFMFGASFLLLRSSECRVRPGRSPRAPLIAHGVALGLMVHATLRVYGTNGATYRVGPMSWLLLECIAPAIALWWPFVRGVPFLRVRVAYGLTRGQGIAREAAFGALALPLVLATQLLWEWVVLPPARGTGLSFEWMREIRERARTGDLAAALFAAPLAGEVLFRGAVYRFLRDSTGRLSRGVGAFVAVSVSSFVFAASYGGGWGGLPYLMILGAGSALLRERRGSMAASITLHAGWWTFVLCVLALGPRQG